MATRNIALYAETALRPQDVVKYSPAAKSAGCTTVILGMFQFEKTQLHENFNVFHDTFPRHYWHRCEL